MITEPQAIEMAVAALRRRGNNERIVETKAWQERGGYSRRGEKRPDWTVAVEFDGTGEGYLPGDLCYYVSIFDDGTIDIPPIL